MPETDYRFYARLNYPGNIEEIFDSTPEKKYSRCHCGPIRLYGKFKGRDIKIECCSDGSEWVYSNSKKKAIGLAKTIGNFKKKKSELDSLV
ncbi:MAG: hypothetical protein PHH54_04625 [Candidatus Nanoarchaeia archaeon]|nr:hypothetical protein [Candidatus Nanoarchaeia archaeon]MDD5741241.1 hypothetical protein [Candidatus Nanoarchaeia archaeon]